MTSSARIEIADFTGYLLHRLGNDTTRVIERALEPTGLRAREVRVLGFLSGEPLSQSALCEISGLDRTTMVAVVDRLEERGLAERRRDPADRRRQAVTRTAGGERTFRKAADLLLSAEDDYLAPLDEGERETLRLLLRRLYRSRTLDC
ncbi:MarR family winged helix-turn-helix transcriptional regulator [Nocardiopsis ganjiahuensis]|uniref:MarR family winged helix-turn-helix transcriptional regulator n=1 Tax=Nocardiopsis ganjiahuensis TaxID=239984 RepID=UPI00034932F2|nr:MarR family winged helix-turn-helix transcriptional regulator [Nocardiopsis ganjiahuensis]